MEILFILLMPVITFALTPPPLVFTSSGGVLGTNVQYKGKTVKRFLGIPFAEPPVRKFRFKKTVPVQPWILLETNSTFPPGCIQHYPVRYPWVDIDMSDEREDCLYLNIWVPETVSGTNPKAVMFWVFSGGFNTGSNRLPVYDGSVLATEGDVIVVNINYRVSILGFLSTESEEAPGNMGLYDVVEALKWVNNNIEAFGGDKNRITVFGQSAGGIAAGYLTISPLAVGLFQRIIMESGSPLIPFGDTRMKNFELGQKVAEAVGCATDRLTLKDFPEEVVICLREKDPKKLVETVFQFTQMSVTTFLPIYGKGDPLLPVEPRMAIKHGHYIQTDVLAGVTEDDGSIFLLTEATERTGPFGHRDPKINKMEGEHLILDMLQDLPTKEEIAAYYLADLTENDYDAVRSQVYHAGGDVMIVCPVKWFAEYFAEKVNSYVYYFEHRLSNTPFANWTGVTHFTEVDFVFGRPLDNPSHYTAEEAQLSKEVIQEWTTFAKYGHPSSEWNQFDGTETSIRKFYVQEMNEDYLSRHLKNCEFLRPRTLDAYY